LRWRGKKPDTGVQEAARAARYRLLAEAALAANARCILTAHTLDDQAETVLFRMMRGSGLTGLGAMMPASLLPSDDETEIMLARPFLDIPKARLVATLDQARIAFARDPSNLDPRFARPRLRELMPALAREGLDARRLAILARRLRRAEAAIEMAVGVAATALSQQPWSERKPIVFDAERFYRLPAEVALRLLARAIAFVGDEGPVELGKVEALFDNLAAVSAFRQTARLRRTLAGALVTLAAGRLTIARAPARKAGIQRLTTAPRARRSPANLR
jgi:tRNA(Ile)-lysidine synthase